MTSKHANQNDLLKEYLPKTGETYKEPERMPVLCKPKIMPLKSVTLEKMEKMQREAQDAVRQQEKDLRVQEQMMLTMLAQQRANTRHETHDEDDRDQLFNS